MSKPDKNDAFKCLILGHEVLQKCNNFFQSNSSLISNPKLGWKKVRSPHITRRFPGEPGASEQQPKGGTTCLLLQYGFELELGTSGSWNKSSCNQNGVGNPQTLVPGLEFDWNFEPSSRM